MKKGFTLAEVLITLAIIGVVAAVTMPAIIQNYQKKAQVVQLKKITNTFVNSFRKIMYDENVDNLFNTNLFYTYTDSHSGDSHTAFNTDEYVKHVEVLKLPENSDFVKYFKVNGAYYFKDGSCFAFPDKEWTIQGFVIVDTNCDKKPNQIGKDRFAISLDSQGILLKIDTFGDIDETSICNKDMLKLTNSDEFDPGVAIIIGMECFYRILYDGWEIKY